MAREQENLDTLAREIEEVLYNFTKRTGKVVGNLSFKLTPVPPNDRLVGYSVQVELKTS